MLGTFNLDITFVLLPFCFVLLLMTAKWEHLCGLCLLLLTCGLSERTVITVAPLDQVVDAGTDAVLECEATTDPMEAAHLTITWRRDGEEIHYEREPRISCDIMDNSLTIVACEEGDSGQYTCVADNGLDSDEFTAVLSVTGKG